MDSFTKEDFFTFFPLKERARGEDTYNESKQYMHENTHYGFIALCRKDPEQHRELSDEAWLLDLKLNELNSEL